MPDRDTLIGTSQAAALLGIHRSTLIRRVQNGRIRAVQKLPAETGGYLFDPADILAHRLETVA